MGTIFLFHKGEIMKYAILILLIILAGCRMISTDDMKDQIRQDVENARMG